MHHTTVDGTSSLNGSPMATGHEFSEDEILVPVTAFDLSVYRGAASVISTANDLVRLDHALRVPGLLLSATSLAEMYTPVRNSYGLGWVVQQDHGLGPWSAIRAASTASTPPGCATSTAARSR